MMVYFTLIRISKEQTSNLYFPTIAAMFLISQIDPKQWESLLIVVHVCFHSSSSLKLNICCNLFFLLTLLNKNSPVGFVLSSQSSNWMISKNWNHYELNHSCQEHDIKCTTRYHAPLPHHTQRCDSGKIRYAPILPLNKNYFEKPKIT